MSNMPHWFETADGWKGACVAEAEHAIVRHHIFLDGRPNHLSQKQLIMVVLAEHVRCLACEIVFDQLRDG
ncbi:MAG: hypothetical protein KDA61_12050 [Planctomycetales bacterium]|nr:hypothetical protein [Planctomycetales bacterium]